MNREFLSPFQLLDSHIESVSFDVIDASLADGSTTVSLSHFFDDDELHQEGIWALKGEISVECKWQDADGETICQGACTIRGAVSVFTSAFADDYPEDEMGLLLRANVVSLLFGKARNTFELLSSSSRAGKKTLPAIDPFKYLEFEGGSEA